MSLHYFEQPQLFHQFSFFFSSWTIFSCEAYQNIVLFFWIQGQLLCEDHNYFSYCAADCIHYIGGCLCRPHLAIFKRIFLRGWERHLRRLLNVYQQCLVSHNKDQQEDFSNLMRISPGRFLWLLLCRSRHYCSTSAPTEESYYPFTGSR